MLRRVRWVLLAMTLFACKLPLAEAGFTSVVDNVSPGGNLPTGLDLTAGWAFTTGNQSVTVYALADYAPTSSGNAVRLYDGSGTTLAAATITQADPTSGIWSYEAIAPLTLSANTTYYIAADTRSGQLTWYSSTNLTTDPTITFNHPVEAFSLGQNPLVDGQNNNYSPGYFGPSFSTSPVPEPTSLALAGLGALALVGNAIRRRAA